MLSLSLVNSFFQHSPKLNNSSLKWGELSFCASNSKWGFHKMCPLCEPVLPSLLASLVELLIYMLSPSAHQDIFPANSIPFKSYLAGLFFFSSCITLHLLNLTFCFLALMCKCYPETDLPWWLLLPSLCFPRSSWVAVTFGVFRLGCWHSIRTLVFR